MAIFRTPQNMQEEPMQEVLIHENINPLQALDLEDDFKQTQAANDEEVRIETMSNAPENDKQCQTDLWLIQKMLN